MLGYRPEKHQIIVNGQDRPGHAGVLKRRGGEEDGRERGGKGMRTGERIAPPPYPPQSKRTPWHRRPDLLTSKLIHGLQ